MRGVPRERRAISVPPSSVSGSAEDAGAAPHDVLELVDLVEIEPDRNAEAVAERRRQQPEARRRADQREGREADLDRARRRPLADDQVELEILERRIEDFLDRRRQPVDLVDEQDVALFEVGEQRGEVAGPGDHRAGGGAEIDAELARDDLRQRRLAEAGRPDEQHVVERLLARPRRLDEHLEVGARLRLTDEFGEQSAGGAARRARRRRAPPAATTRLIAPAPSARARMSCSGVAASPARARGQRPRRRRSPAPAA